MRTLLLSSCVYAEDVSPASGKNHGDTKEDGSKRPLALSCIEDKLVQLAVSDILSSVYEPLFLPCSYGFRPGLNCHAALKALQQQTFRNWNGAVVEIDIRKYFNTIPHTELMNLLRKKTSDRRFLRLVEVSITAPVIRGKRYQRMNRVARRVRPCRQYSLISTCIM